MRKTRKQGDCIAHFAKGEVQPQYQRAAAVRDALKGEISESCPASILRTKPGSILYLDQESASAL